MQASRLGDDKMPFLHTNGFPNILENAYFNFRPDSTYMYGILKYNNVWPTIIIYYQTKKLEGKTNIEIKRTATFVLKYEHYKMD